MSVPYTRLARTTLWLLAGDDAFPSIYIGKSLITNAQYEAFDAAHARCEVSPGDDHPVVNVSWEEASAYCAWYARASGKAFRLPGEAEWAWACRAGRAERWWWGDDALAGASFAWTAENSAGRTHPIESLRANPWGLHDMLGLCWEWTNDAAADGATRIARGGSWRTPLAHATCDARLELPAGERRDDVGFRIVREM